MLNDDFGEHLAEDRRLVILRVLLESAAFKANEYILQRMLETLGHVVSHDRVRTDMAWLREQELVTVEVIGGMHIATLTSRGDDVANGRSTQPGVKRPRAGS